jgi:hypothetical protein
MIETTGRVTSISYLLGITGGTGNGEGEKFHISIRCPLVFNHDPSKQA